MSPSLTKEERWMKGGREEEEEEEEEGLEERKDVLGGGVCE